MKHNSNVFPPTTARAHCRPTMPARLIVDYSNLENIGELTTTFLHMLCATISFEKKKIINFF